MTAPAASTPRPDDADPDEARRRALLDRQLDRLDQLIGAGMDLVQGLAAQAAGGPKVVEGDVALAYSRLSRAVRMAMLLQSRLVAEPEAETPPQDDDDPASMSVYWIKPGEILTEQRLARSERVEQIVESIARGETGDDEAAEHIRREAAERLERDDIYGDVLTRPVSELVFEICRDLNLAPDWPRLARQPWARREMDGGKAGAPLKAHLSPPQAASP
jgi:hypothetical protein